MKLSQLAEICGAKLDGDGDHEVNEVSAPETAGRSHLCFVTSKQYLPRLEQGRAGAVLAPPGMMVPQGMNVLRHADPDLAFSKALAALRGEPARPQPGIAEHVAVGRNFEMGDNASVGAFSSIGDDVRIGRNVVIHPHCHIGDGVTIGDDTVLYPRVTILERCSIGRRCILFPGVVIGADGFGYHFDAGRFVKAPQLGTVEIGDDVEIGANSTVDRARFDVTRVGNGTKLDNLVQVGHNVQIGQHCVIAAQTGIAGSTVVKDYVRIGGQVGLSDHITIGMGAQVAAKTGVIRDVPPGMKVAGLPAEEGRQYMKREANIRKLPETMERLKELSALVAHLAAQVGLPPEDDTGLR
jgi:UDP-3-O-[3-hydroxymyristoyl] glucosamine N-acyltransferase